VSEGIRTLTNGVTGRSANHYTTFTIVCLSSQLLCTKYNLVDEARLERAKLLRSAWVTAKSNCRYTTHPWRKARESNSVTPFDVSLFSRQLDAIARRFPYFIGKSIPRLLSRAIIRLSAYLRVSAVSHSQFGLHPCGVIRD
jgi:hypothetical protein